MVVNKYKNVKNKTDRTQISSQSQARRFTVLQTKSKSKYVKNKQKNI